MDGTGERRAVSRHLSPTPSLSASEQREADRQYRVAYGITRASRSRANSSKKLSSVAW
ncbi:MAG: hypothetical protein JWP04_2127 [Belnapia sp.]|nr:hypothetical protein [Belnapia sp.]